MIAFIKGKIANITQNSVIVDNNGIGYEILCPLNDIAGYNDKINEEIFIFTCLIHREDSMTLFGFSSQKAKDGFLGLQKVGGIGPKAALKILSFYDVEDLFDCVEREDIQSLQAIPGVGPKMAKQIIFDLKGVLPSLEKNKDSSIERDLISAMINLGFKDGDIRNKLNEMKPISDNFESEFKRLLRKLS